ARQVCLRAIWRQLTIRGDQLRRANGDAAEDSSGQVALFSMLAKYGSHVRCLEFLYSNMDGMGPRDLHLFRTALDGCPHINSICLVSADTFISGVAGISNQEAMSLVNPALLKILADGYADTAGRLKSVTLVCHEGADDRHIYYNDLCRILCGMPSLREIWLSNTCIQPCDLKAALANKPIRGIKISDELGLCNYDAAAILDVVADLHLIRELRFSRCLWLTAHILDPLFRQIASAGVSELTRLSIYECLDVQGDQLLERLSPAKFPYLKMLEIEACCGMDSEMLESYFSTHAWPRLCSLSLNHNTISMKLLPLIGGTFPNLRALSISCDYAEADEDKQLYLQSIGDLFNDMLGKLSRLQHLEFAHPIPELTRTLFGPSMAAALLSSLVSVKIVEDSEDSQSDVQGIASGLLRMQALRSITVKANEPDDMRGWLEALGGSQFEGMSFTCSC
ncbi:hypothetical protein GGI12_002493, partial [Dipsacomyces acuminosporus]